MPNYPPDIRAAAYAAVTTLARVCSWCDRDRTQTQALVRQGREVTHGVCPAHAAALHAELDALERDNR